MILTDSQPMNVTWVPSFPTGHEAGSYITIDMGGTNLRICNVELAEHEAKYNITQDKYKLPDELRRGTSDELWELIAEKLLDFLAKHNLPAKRTTLPLASTFSFPVTREHIRHGELQTWTKGFAIQGVERKDVVSQLEMVLKKKNVPVRIVALVNDTVGTLIATAYKNPDVRVGSIFGTGCNAAYMERCAQIPKIADESKKFHRGSIVSINCKYGAFDIRRVRQQPSGSSADEI